jgi:hypothetical protein
MRSKPQSSPEHWSKDFVEHLRTVHFALLTVSVGLILLLTSKPYDARKAAGEMTQILQINSLAHLEPEGDLGTTQPDNVEYSPWLSATTTRGKVSLHLVEPNLFICNPEPGKHYFHHLEPSLMPNTIHSFAVWWDSLYRHDSRIVSIMRFHRKGVVLDESKGRMGDLTIASIGSHDDRAITLSLEGLCETDGSSDKELVVNGADGRYRFLLVVAANTSQAFNQSLISRKSAHVTQGFFGESFPNLAKAAEGREDLDLATLAPQIYSEATKGDEAFEVFGVKIPSNEITRWGIVFLIGIQLYLVMYLRRLNDKLRSDDPGWDVPWMAMDESRLARSMLFASVVLLPTLAAYCVLRQNQHQASQTVWGILTHSHELGRARTLIELLQSFLVPVGCLVSVCLSLLCWRYRPKLSESIGPAQLDLPFK